MTDPGTRLAAIAESFIGTPFRLHGRDGTLGLDCIGLVELALAEFGISLPIQPTYALRNRDIGHWLASADTSPLLQLSASIEPGDILLVQPSVAQHHATIAVTGSRFVHAHASLKRVVCMPGPLPWPIARQWRLPPSLTDPKET